MAAELKGGKQLCVNGKADLKVIVLGKQQVGFFSIIDVIFLFQSELKAQFHKTEVGLSNNG